ncbi:ATP-binding protein [Bacillus infantis]|uniref:ATP-binding protein n=1 Tax=Bacillus infantis TaxID=324767 RepID=UPI0020054892|nr:ATP-binding protein [Bacillus infantis]MCK6203956.1 ATP-binding protein [Bacillus infantis]
MEKLSIPQALRKNITFHSSYCEKHTYRKNGEDVVNPVQRMEINGQVVCPRCEVDKDNQKIEAEQQEKYKELLASKQESDRPYHVLRNKSILTDHTLLEATFENFTVECEEERKNKEDMLDAAARLQDGQVFNVILQGKQGTGKSHLSYSLLRHLNEASECSCCFVSIDEMLRKIKDSFNNKESKYTESYFVDLLSNVKYLVLDDLGAETGAIDTEKTATDFVQRVLYAVASSRQDKATILTTNLDSKTLFRMYDKKLVSRLLRSPKFILFKDSKDKRISNLPF